MDELDLFRNFRLGVREPGADAERRASARLAQAIDRRQGARTRLVGVVLRRPRGIALSSTVLAGTAAAALFITTPWTSTPGFLERAHAALTPPAGTILHLKTVETVTSKDFGCTSSRRLEFWIDRKLPQPYRAIISWPPPLQAEAETPRAVVCGEANTQIEIGSQIQPLERGFEFVPPNTLRRPRFGWPRALFPSNPVRDLRQAISQGRAHDEGRTTLGGRTVERIRVDPPGCPTSFCPPNRPRDPSYTYVDPKTFALVQDEITLPVWGGPLKHPVLVDIVARYVTFEYLPRTSANLALTSIRAQHPDATVKCTPTWQYRC